ncbi:SIS domain-containing protein [Enterococcus sp. MJM12]|uniref:Fructosamine deglycase n=1 Tax=Candidatus Enterococcus myersii TaxID=2815322 RepID=A0ABS3H3E9_9ENTE|nr:MULTISPECIES: SIS domain-containing protein [Enterococcus]MBO0447980.1 SIS domain-containing protein [Enterococcus sp. MJM12]MCD1024846.1 SIS domain-containing protein [Enterococcus sp. SMC-9]WHA08967.1 SIS domain-containing protein [Enterococcus montenegrensis]
MDVTKTVEKILAKNEGQLSGIYFVACGGSLVDMYVAEYFMKAESSKCFTGWYTANEFCHVPPKALDENSVVILCSHGGNTKETVAAGNVAQSRGAQTVGLTHNKEADLFSVSNYSFLYDWGADAEVKNNPMAIILDLTVSLVAQTEGYAHYDKFKEGMGIIDTVVKNAINQVQERVKVFADKYQNDTMFYIMGSGPSYGHAYGFSICSLMEMQWLDSTAVHSGEYFHGPFEVTDQDRNYIMLMSEGRSRPLDERAKTFLQAYAKNVEYVDAKELGLDLIAQEVNEFFNPILFYSVLAEYRLALANVRQHDLDVRRYMGKVAY